MGGVGGVPECRCVLGRCRRFSPVSSDPRSPLLADASIARRDRPISRHLRVDEASNTTSYLLVLARHGLIRHHAVERPFAKDDFGKWTHWAALIRERESGELFAIDSSASVNGENPTVQSAASFYVPDSSADAKPPETSRYAGPDDMMAGFSDEGSATSR
jgi:hypothetical protein